MDHKTLFKKRAKFQEIKKTISEITLTSFENSFEIEYTHNSTAIEGNTLSLMETKVLLEDGISIGGKHLRELYEAVNHRKAYRYVKDCIQDKKPLSEPIVKDIHMILMDNIFHGGIYRDMDVYISGAQFTPPSPNLMYQEIKNFFADLAWKGDVLDAIDLAAWTHAEFVRIHPFPDGNGRTSRLIMNYQLMFAGLPAISIAKENRLPYFEALEHYAIHQDLTPFSDMVACLVEKQLDTFLNMN